MATRCPNCGNDVPDEMGQHAPGLIRGTVDCPRCGTRLNLREEPGGRSGGDVVSGDVERATAAPPGQTEGQEAFAGQEDLVAVAEELRDKPT